MVSGRSAPDKFGGAKRDRTGGDINSELSIVIPAFNEQDRLPGTLDRLLSELPSVLDGAWEIIVSDDGSTDDTAAVVLGLDAAPRVRLVGTDQNQGKGAALVRGTEAALYPAVLFLDADLPVPVSTIPDLLAAHRSADLVVGSRRLPGASCSPPQPLVRRAGGHVFRTVISTLGFDITSDPQCGVKLLHRERLADVMKQVTCTGFAFDVELIVRARRAGLRVEEVPVAWSHVEGSTLRPFRDAVNTIGELVRLQGRLNRTEVAVS